MYWPYTYSLKLMGLEASICGMVLCEVSRERVVVILFCHCLCIIIRGIKKSRLLVLLVSYKLGHQEAVLALLFIGHIPLMTKSVFPGI